MQQKVCPRCGEYFVMNCNELLGVFFQKRRINTILCGRCQKDDCYDCSRFNFIRTIRKKRFFRKTDWSKERTMAAPTSFMASF